MLLQWISMDYIPDKIYACCEVHMTLYDTKHVLQRQSRLRSMPIHPKKIRPRLLIYNKTSDEWRNLNLKKWSSNNQSSIVITHGWAPEKSGKEERLHLLYAKEFYKLLSTNEPERHLLALDWKRGASSLNYPECYNNIRVVARFIYKQLSEVDFNFETAHLIGHSLGAHLMGYLAKETMVRNTPYSAKYCFRLSVYDFFSKTQ